MEAVHDKIEERIQVESRGVVMLENKLGISNHIELAKVEEKLSKQKAKELFETGKIDQFEVGTFRGLADIHHYLFEEIYDFAGELREVNISKGNFRFAPVLYLKAALEKIDSLPQGTFDEIVQKYVEKNIAHPFREGNGRAMRIWLAVILKQEQKVIVDWSKIKKGAYLSAMERSPVNDLEIKHVLKEALTEKTNDREIYMKGIDASYFYEGYTEYRTEEL